MKRRPRLAIFRPKEKLPESVRLAEARGYEVLAVPMLETRPRDEPRFAAFLETLEEGAVDVVVFTSSNGVTYAFHGATRTMEREDFRDALNQARVVAIGTVTRRALEHFGVQAEVPLEFSSRGLVEHFERTGVPGRRVALLRSGQGSPELPEGLRSLGYRVRDVPLYDVGLPDDLAPARAFFDRVARGEVDVFAFLSSKTVHNFLELAATLGMEEAVRASLSRATVAAIGGPTKETLEGEGISVAVAPPKATFEDLLDALASMRNVEWRRSSLK
ncbi:MAG: uroporphyrinogen-III synthase [Euryarchaeota archaeon]|nr:uroporphyrinogen-III synthase [Euryarchaeota archaeon]